MNDDQLGLVLLELVHELSGVRPTRSAPSLHFLEYGIDSVLAVELAMMVEEQFGVEVPNGALSRWTCVDDVIRYLKTCERHPDSSGS